MSPFSKKLWAGGEEEACLPFSYPSVQVAFDLPIEGSVIQMKPATLALKDTVISLKAYLAK